MPKSKSYKEYLYAKLRDPEAASAYLDEALKDEDIHVFLLALRDIAEANGGIGTIARKAHLNRESLYRTLSPTGNPKITSLKALMGACGLELSVRPAVNS
jgi:probable addiction module antidote protein